MSSDRCCTSCLLVSVICSSVCARAHTHAHIYIYIYIYMLHMVASNISAVFLCAVSVFYAFPCGCVTDNYNIRQNSYHI
jgi:hypothetical protein